MKTSALLTGFLASQALAHPGMGRVMAEIKARDDFNLEGRSTDLIGDLKNGTSTSVGNTIKSILQGASAISTGGSYTAPGPLGSDACSKDPLCLWSYVVKDLSSAFVDANGCTDAARGAIRLGFHDAATWDKDSTYGGADGSIVLSDELSRRENRGLAAIGAQTKGWYDKYHPYGAGMADIIQTSAIVATVSCPAGPRIKAYVGRKDNPTAGPTGKLPSPFQDAQSLIDLFAAKTFSASDLVALVGAHSSSKQFFVDPARAGAPQDSTPGTWDTKFYGETLKGDNKTILIFPSDKNLATYSATKAQWNVFAGAAGPATWGPAYASAYFRMSMLGLDNINNLTEISRLIPQPR
ncbi:peroxidase manganese-dependent 1 [Xylariaceae sp. FL0016]|nr:peroxidase manganese-dependent 1 [Xylariaceae sp. FL0016]